MIDAEALLGRKAGVTSGDGGEEALVATVKVGVLWQGSEDGSHNGIAFRVFNEH